MSDSARHNLFYLLESVFGTTPSSSPEFKPLRHTGTTIGTSKGTNLSEELHADRQIRDFRHGTKTVAGDVNFEFSHGSFDGLLEAVLLGTWTNDVLKAGTVRRSMTLLRQFTDQVAGDKPYHLFKGCELNTLNLSVVAENIVTGSFGVMGKTPDVQGDLTSLGVPTFASDSTTEPFDAFTGTIKEGEVASGIITELNLSLTNNLESRFVIGEDSTLEHSIGRSNITGSINAYFQNATLLEKFLNETESSIEFTLTDPANNSYTILLPKIKYTGGQPDVSGQGSIPINLPFQAIYDATEASNIKVTRTP